MSSGVFLGQPGQRDVEWIDSFGTEFYIQGEQEPRRFLVRGEINSDFMTNHGIEIDYVENVNFGKKVHSIGSSVFINCTKLLSVSMPKVQNIGEYSFFRCNNLKSVSMPNVQNVGLCAFSYCTNLPSVDVSNVSSVGGYAFTSCTSLLSVDMPNVKNVDIYAFDGCTSLTSIIIGSGIESIGEDAFIRNNSLVRVTIGKDEETVRGMTNFPWSLPDGSTIYCSDGGHIDI